MAWKPDVTVAAIAEVDGQFLLVEERARGRLVLNQPAGHLEEGETFLDAVVRETLEETAWHFVPDQIVGVYLWRPTHIKTTFLRVCFNGALQYHEAHRPLDEGILRTRWLSRAQLSAMQPRLRSPLVLRCVDDYLAGTRYPLEVLTHLIQEPITIAASG